MRDRNKFRGCIFGGAAGDALGYAVEFSTSERIKQKYGENGISSYELKNGIAEISDDTQMTLFTANALLIRTNRGMVRGIAGSPEDYCWDSYKAWLKTQNEDYPGWKKSVSDPDREYPFLIRIPELHARRAPGKTVVTILRNDIKGTVENQINDSKGCGGIMRAAPVGLFFDRDGIERICTYGAEIAALTHGHPLGYIPAAALVYIINRITYAEENVEIENLIYDCIEQMKRLFEDKPYIDDFIDIIKKAVELSKSGFTDEKAISILGEGWVAEETFAIAVYCCLKYPDNFEKAVIASVNHSGDSDSTGSVTGNIMGAMIGYDSIPEKFKTNLELRDVILQIADDLCMEFSDDEKWWAKYAC